MAEPRADAQHFKADAFSLANDEKAKLIQMIHFVMRLYYYCRCRHLTRPEPASAYFRPFYLQKQSNADRNEGKITTLGAHKRHKK